MYIYNHSVTPPGQPEVVFLLLNAGLNPRQKDSYGQVYTYICLLYYNINKTHPNKDTLLIRTPHWLGHLTNQDTSLVRTPH